MSLEKQINETLEGIIFDVEGLSGHINAEDDFDVKHAELSVYSAERLMNKANKIHAIVCRRTDALKENQK